jgi:hypothetical protein
MLAFKHEEMEHEAYYFKEGDTMSIHLKLNEKSAHFLFLSDIHGGRLAFKKDPEQQLVAEVSMEEFNEFCKTNNLITYRNALKNYENGEVFGEFH